MSRRRPRLWLPTSLVAAYLALGWLIYQQLAGASPPEALARIQPQRTPTQEELPPELQFTMAAIEDFDNVLERPLFSPSRRPPEELAAPAVAQAFDYVLKGVLIDTEARTALLSHADSADILRLSEGSEIAGWRLQEVGEDFIVVERNGDEQVIELNFPSPPSRNASGR